MPFKEVKSTFVPDLFAQDIAPVKETKTDILDAIQESELMKPEETVSNEILQNIKASSIIEKAFDKDQPKKIIRLITLYDDNTFDSYEPSVH